VLKRQGIDKRSTWMAGKNSTSDNKELSVVILAAGKGKRMKSGVPKVLHEICGRPLLGYVLDAVGTLGAGEVAIVIGNGADEVRAAAGDGYRFVHQAEQKGTGHAVMKALEEMDPRFREVLVLPGDTPLITGETLARLSSARRARRAAAAMLTAVLDDPTGYGRVCRDEKQAVSKIAEEVDASVEERAIREVNACTYAFDRDELEKGLETLTTDNAQGEYYLTGVIERLTTRSLQVVAVRGSAEEILGVNDRRQLAEAGRITRRRINDRLMMDGITIIDPDTTYIDYGIEIGRETTVMPMVFITGATTIGEDCHIGPCTAINESVIGGGCDIRFSSVDGCSLASGVTVGPFSRLRPGCELGPHARAGSFVEMKKTVVGKGSKVPHLSYMGDATIGEDANVGAGSITCNYDGETKSPTTIGDRAFIGSDTMMVAPVRIGDDAVTGAGSVISEDVPDGALGIERTEQKNILDFRKKGKSEKDG
jgi:bifunctional UDP-N-acetylglucosamine pyrophosphorylase/glucosamine-1-phosphate N-acetyltransferase